MVGTSTLTTSSHQTDSNTEGNERKIQQRKREIRLHTVCSKKGQERYTDVVDYTGGKKGSTTPYSKGKGKYQSRPYYVKGRGQ
eukprot:6476349-Amphidinium_carterae.1